MSSFGKSDIEQLKDFCESHWLKKVTVDEAKSTLKIGFKHKSYLIPFLLNFFGSVKEVRYSGLVFPIDESASVRLIFPEKKPDDLTIVLTIGEVITLDVVQKNYENGKDMVFVTTSNIECALKRERA